MAELEDTQFESGDSGASATFPMQCSALRKNGFVMLKVFQLLFTCLSKHCVNRVLLTGKTLQDC